MEWIETSQQLPPEGIPVIGFSPEWVDEDFNIKGIRECFLNGTGEFISAKWWDYQDTYVNKEDETPTHWQHYPETPEESKLLEECKFYDGDCTHKDCPVKGLIGVKCILPLRYFHG